MKPLKPLLVPLAAALLLGACQSSTSHWNPDYASESASFHFFGANGSSAETIPATTRDGSRSITLTMRRHFFNDNPQNPLQAHRYDPYERYIPIWDMPVNAVVDTGEIVGVAGARTGQGAYGLILMPWQLLAGTPEVSSHQAPPPPKDFSVKNR